MDYLLIYSTLILYIHHSHTLSYLPTYLPTYLPLDVITLSTTSTPSGLSLNEKGISWSTDRSYKYQQVKGFASQVVSSSSSPCPLSTGCSGIYHDTTANTYTAYYYPNDATTQYLYESYPDHISPLGKSYVYILV